MCFHVFKNKKREGFQRKTFPFLFRILACVYTKEIDQPSEIAPTGHWASQAPQSMQVSALIS